MRFKALVVGVWIVLMILASLPGGAQQASEPMTPSQAQTGRLLFQTDQQGLYEPAPGVETDVWIQVTGFIARTVLRQSFVNPGDTWREGIYVFPLPDGSAVDGMRLVIGDRIIEGDIQERRQAKKTYERAKREGKKASLVEQARPNMFTTSVANIGPGERIDVVIEYQEDLRFDSGLFRLRFPMVVNPRYMSSAAAPEPVLQTTWTPGDVVADPTPASGAPDVSSLTPPVLDAGLENPVTLMVELDAGMPLEFVQSWSHELAVEEEGSRLVIQPTAGIVPADRDFVLEWRPAQGHEPQASAIVEEYEGAQYLLLMLMPPKPSTLAVRVPKETIFILDRSGSMAGAPMRQAKEALGNALDQLAPEDRFNVVLFSHEAEKLFPQSVPADPFSVGNAKARLAAVEGDGGTEMMPALEAALSQSEDEASHGALRQVIFITDGSVGNEETLFGYIRKNLGKSRLFTIGIGSAPNSYFMRKAAQFGGGTFTFIGDSSEVASKMNELFAKIEHPVLRDLKLSWSDPEVDAWPRRPGDLYLGEPLVLTARSEAGFGDLLLEGIAGQAGWDRHLTFEKSSGSRGIHKLWARKNVESLMDSLVDGANRDEVRGQVVELGLRHHLVTRYTSLVAVDKTPSRPQHEALSSERVPVHRPAGVLPRGGTASRIQVLLGLLLLVAAWRVRRGS